MNKVADKTPDPVQQSLRLAKKQWNKDVSAFIDNLIHYKKLTNGQPNKFFKERSNIKDPIPADPTAILGSLAGNFQELSRRGNDIINHQIEYSKNRKKKSSNVVASLNDYNLISEGSNIFSRFFTRLLTPTFGTSEAARVKKYRMSLLSSCATIYKDLEKLQVEVVRSTPESIVNAYKLLHQIRNSWAIVHSGFMTYKENMPISIKDSGGEINLPEKLEDISKSDADVIIKAKDIISDYIKNYEKLTSFIKFDDSKIDPAITSFLKSTKNNKLEEANKLIAEYTSFVNSLNLLAETDELTINDIVKKLENIDSTDKLNPNDLEKTAQDFLKKWVGKTKHQLSFFDKTSPFRLDIYKMIEEMRKDINIVMDHLEKDMNMENLQPVVNQVHKKFLLLVRLMRALSMSFSNKNMLPDLYSSILRVK